jgi:hypothetical protein
MLPCIYFFVLMYCSRFIMWVESVCFCIWFKFKIKDPSKPFKNNSFPFSKIYLVSRFSLNSKPMSQNPKIDFWKDLSLLRALKSPFLILILFYIQILYINSHGFQLLKFRVFQKIRISLRISKTLFPYILNPFHLKPCFKFVYLSQIPNFRIWKSSQKSNLNLTYFEFRSNSNWKCLNLFVLK